MVVRGDPDDDEFFVPAHWHEDHNEIITVLEGRLQVTLGSEMKIYTPESGAAFIPRGIAHSLRAFKGERCVVTEETNPMVCAHLCLQIRMAMEWTLAGIQ